MLRAIKIAALGVAGMLTGCQQAAPPPAGAPTAAAGVDVVRAKAADKLRFKLYKTQNLWTFLLLDTRTGKIWQVQYSLKARSEAGTVPLSTDELANGPENRFELTATDNLWNFVLLDRVDGRTWQCQYSMQESGRGCVAIDAVPKAIGQP
jgi:hypothetical protein